MASFPDQTNPGAFVPTTNIWDPSEIYSTDVTSPEFKELLVRLYQNLNNMALSLNIRDAGYYDRTEFVCGQLYFPDTTLSSSTGKAPTYRQVFRKVINFGALPNTGTQSIAHGLTITSGFTFTRIYGCASDPSTSFIPIPYPARPAGQNIEITVDATNIVIDVGAVNRSNFTVCYVVLEYIKE